MKTFRGLFDKWRTEYQNDLKGAEGVKQRFSAIEAKYAAKNSPGRMEPPYEVESIRAWAKLTKEYTDSIAADFAFIKSTRGMGGIDKQRQSRLQAWVGSDWPRRIKDAKRYIADRVHGYVQMGLDTAKFLRGIKAENEHMVLNNVLAEGAFDQNIERLQQGLHSIEVARAFEEGLGVKATADRAAQRRDIETAIEHMRKLAVSALAAVRMPKAKSTDAKLLKAAAETLKRKKYGVQPWKRLVINADVRRYEKEEGTIRPDTNVTRVTVYKYVWDQFQVTTVEQVGEEFWMFFNTLKFYHQADPLTPTQKWILSRRFKSTRILEENIEK